MKTTRIIATTMIIAVLWMAVCQAADFIHPMDFDGSESQKKAVISYIEECAKKSCAEVGLSDPSTLRMMEKQNLSAFKALTQAKDRKMLDMVIQQCDRIWLVDYSTIKMMYDQQVQASKDELSW